MSPIGRWPSSLFFDLWEDIEQEMERWSRRFERPLDAFLQRKARTAAASPYPPINLSEDEENFYVQAEIPGVHTEDMEVCVKGKLLTISGERSSPQPQGEVRLHHRERKSGSFNRNITLPIMIDINKVSAECKHGILTIILPKK